nr:MAG TPA: hypothetical protein [Caudoviricetes sp.]
MCQMSGRIRRLLLAVYRHRFVIVHQGKWVKMGERVV